MTRITASNCTPLPKAISDDKQARESGHIQNTKDKSKSLPIEYTIARLSFLPRAVCGLVNAGNTCFINSVLQSLLSCDPFRALLRTSKAPQNSLLDKFIKLDRQMSCEMVVSGIRQQVSRLTLQPVAFHNVFPESQTENTFHRRQEDAEEFLTFLLNKLDGELKDLRRNRGNSYNADTPISTIFGGTLLSEVKRPFECSSVTKQPFLSLSLDIGDQETNIEKALSKYFEAELLDDSTMYPKNKRISKQMFLERMPEVLILHLMRFSQNFSTGSLTKLTQRVSFPEILEVPEIFLRDQSSEREEDEGKLYELTAVVVHLGSSIDSGHYNCDVKWRQETKDCWVRCDDERVREVPVEDVCKRSAYLLLYTAVPHW